MGHYSGLARKEQIPAGGRYMHLLARFHNYRECSGSFVGALFKSRIPRSLDVLDGISSRPVGSHLSQLHPTPIVASFFSNNCIGAASKVE